MLTLEQIHEIGRELESIYCLKNAPMAIRLANRDAGENLLLGLLADLKEGRASRDPGDEGILAAAEQEIARAEDAKYVPQTSVLLKDGKYFVNLKKLTGEMEEIPVEIGLISGTSVQIISDIISGGDEIELDVHGTNDTGGFNPFAMFAAMGGGGNRPSGGGRPR